MCVCVCLKSNKREQFCPSEFSKKGVRIEPWTILGPVAAFQVHFLHFLSLFSNSFTAWPCYSLLCGKWLNANGPLGSSQKVSICPKSLWVNIAHRVPLFFGFLFVLFWWWILNPGLHCQSTVTLWVLCGLGVEPWGDSQETWVFHLCGRRERGRYSFCL
jgi:hypothetical protein